jgi:hypothetical protein
MPFRVLPTGAIECDTPEEAVALARTMTTNDGLAGEFLPNGPLRHGPWTAKRLDTLLEHLGSDQKLILSTLITQTRATADDLRKIVGVDTNQALAGILSGISKQSAALGISARNVFGIENSRRAGVLSKSFFISEDLQKIAISVGWPRRHENKL